MRKLLGCLHSLRRHSLPAYGHRLNYFRRGPNTGGHEVVEVANGGWAKANVCKGQSVRCLAHAECTTADYLFVRYFDPVQVEGMPTQFQRMGVPLCEFLSDNIREFLKPPAEDAPLALH